MSSNQRPTKKTKTLRSAIKAHLSDMLSFAGIQSTAKQRGDIVYRVMKQNKQQNYRVDPKSPAVVDAASKIFIALDIK